MLIKDALNLKVPPQKAEGFMLKTDGHIVVDLGDDVYTQGKPHPMIDPAKRIECMQGGDGRRVHRRYPFGHHAGLRFP
ncbi:MAG: hypothetical protein ACLTW9_07700 [Enterocloster sp.]